MQNLITIYELSQHLNQYLTINDYTDICPNGLQVTNEGYITSIGTAVSPDLATIEKAIERKVQVLITHHGIFKNNETTILNGSKFQKIKKLIENNIALLVYHLPLDAHQIIGNNWKAARDLGWDNLQPFGEYNGNVIGVRGTFLSIDAYEFTKKLEKYYGNKAAVAIAKPTISSAALISGGGYKYIVEAAKAGVDCFITGSFDEPSWYTAFEENINFYGLGHAATEKIGPKALAEYIQKQFSMSATFIDTQNPF